MQPLCTSANLCFYALSEEHLQPFFELVKLEEIGNFMRFQTAQTMRDADIILHDYIDGNYAFAIYEQEQMIGVYAYKQTQKPFVFDISVFFAPNAWGKGYFKETLHAMIPYAFEVLQANVLQGYVLESNIGSRKAVLSCGFQEVRMVHPEDADQDLYVYQLWKEQ